MKLIKLGLFLFILNAQFLCAQNIGFNKEVLKNDDVQLLNQFWTNFKEAVNAEDKITLSSLINFPIICDYCQDEASKSLYVKISKKQFDKKYYKFFLDPKLVARVNSIQDIFSILAETYDVHKNSSLNFGYVSIEPSVKSEGQGHYFSLEKKGNKYFITSMWTIP